MGDGHRFAFNISPLIYLVFLASLSCRFLYAAAVQITTHPLPLESLLEERTRTLRDEYGSFYAWIEGGFGGETVLVWTPRALALEALRALPKRFKGRIVLGLDASPGHAAPFDRALYWAEPRRALVVQEGQGVATSFAGAKETQEGEWVAWDDPRPPKVLEVEVYPGFSYTEQRAYAPWNANTPELGDLPEFSGSPVTGLPGICVAGLGWERGIPTYGLGLVGLGESLETLLRTWRLV